MAMSGDKDEPHRHSKATASIRPNPHTVGRQTAADIQTEASEKMVWSKLSEPRLLQFAVIQKKFENLRLAALRRQERVSTPPASASVSHTQKSRADLLSCNSLFTDPSSLTLLSFISHRKPVRKRQGKKR